MSDKFNAIKEAAELREAAQSEVHSDKIPTGPHSLLSLSGDMRTQDDWNQVGAALEQGNSRLSFAPKASIERDGHGDVHSITFEPGSLDFKGNPRQILIAPLKL